MPWGLNAAGESDPAESTPEHAPDGGGAYVSIGGVTVKIGVNEGRPETSISYTTGIILEGGVEATKTSGQKVDLSPNAGMSLPPVGPLDSGWDFDPTKIGTDSGSITGKAGVRVGPGATGGYLKWNDPRLDKSSLPDSPLFGKGDLPDAPLSKKGDLPAGPLSLKTDLYPIADRGPGIPIYLQPPGKTGDNSPRPPSSIGTDAGTRGKSGSSPSGADPVLKPLTYGGYSGIPETKSSQGGKKSGSSNNSDTPSGSVTDSGGPASTVGSKKPTPGYKYNAGVDSNNPADKSPSPTKKVAPSTKPDYGSYSGPPTKTAKKDFDSSKAGGGRRRCQF
jgi:hypothetical protein